MVPNTHVPNGGIFHCPPQQQGRRSTCVTRAVSRRSDAHIPATAGVDSADQTGGTVSAGSTISEAGTRGLAVGAESRAPNDTSAHAAAAGAARREGIASLPRAAGGRTRRALAGAAGADVTASSAVVRIVGEIVGAGLGIGADAAH